MILYVGILVEAAGNWRIRIAGLPECTGLGPSPKDAFFNVTDSMRRLMAHKLSAGHKLAAPLTLAEVLKSGELAPGETTIFVPLLMDSGRTVRVNVTLDAGLLLAVDLEAERRELTRSAFFASAARDKLERWI